MKRIGIAGFLHESNSFSPIPTPYQHFKETSYTTGKSLLDRWEGTHHQLGGFLEGAKQFGFKPVPIFATYGIPSAPMSKESFEQLSSDMISLIQTALPLDGLLLALHGAAVSEPFPDADGELLARIRRLVGPSLPIVSVIDLHANVSPEMINATHALISYRSNPHLDQRQCGIEGSSIIMRILNQEISPIQALECPPLLINITKQYTNEAPSKQLYSDLETVLNWPGILSASTAMGFYYSDVKDMGASFWAISDSNPSLAKKAAQWLAQRAWDRRQQFLGDLPNAKQAVHITQSKIDGPIVLMDVGDNVGGGGPGDSTFLLSEIVCQKTSNALVVLFDPEAVLTCVEKGVRQSIDLLVGGKTDDHHGQPVRIKGKIRLISDGRSLDTQPRHGGHGLFDQGLTAVIQTLEGHLVVLTTLRSAPRSLEQLYALAIVPENMHLIVAKGVVAPRAAYEAIASQTIIVDTPGATTANPANFKFQHCRRSLYPLVKDVKYSASTL